MGAEVRMPQPACLCFGARQKDTLKCFEKQVWAPKKGRQSVPTWEKVLIWIKANL